MNNCTMTGRLTKDAELSFTTGSGIAVSKFTIAVPRDIKDKTSGKYESDFINCQAWNKTAEFIANYSGKGKLVEVVGRWETRNYTNQDGKKVYTNTLIVDKFKPLEWGEKATNDDFKSIDDDEDIPF